ncbi:calcium-binding protein [Shimia ponticola]|uniref:calcium-binding protein n=1 Tax=Shimia ponticola TaxID=2582893 RepID=UPI0011BFE456|nr:calcium-binding protein [Shimia ponticola]
MSLINPIVEPVIIVETHTLRMVVDETVNTQLVLTFAGDNLVLNQFGVPIGGTITDFTLGYDFDQVLLADLYGPDVDAEDRVFSQGTNVEHTFEAAPADSSVDLFVLSFAVQHALQLKEDSDSGIATSFFIGGDAVSEAFTRYDDYVILSGSGYDLNLRAGDDRLDARDGNAGGVATLGTGDDRFDGSAFSDVIHGASGDDFMMGHDGNDQLRGNAGNDVLWAGDGNDILRGGAGDDVLYSDAGVNSVVGGRGRDVLIAADAGNGIDRLAGGHGADCFVFSIGANERDGGRTIIRDFDLTEDVLRIGPTNNGTYDVGEALARFLDGASQWGDHVRFVENGYLILIRNLDLVDLSVDHFVGPDAGNYFDWASS